ncbi:MAG: response regulator transcription factor [Chloroflexota bacterium]|jgi:two-component system OmpR family response regulator
MRALVVEDEHALGDAVRTALSRDGWAVDLVGDGTSALAWGETYPYDLVVLDLVIPPPDGIAVCQGLRGLGYRGPIIMLTALDEVEDRVRGLDAGADDYLPKPFAMAELLARTRALRRRGTGDLRPAIEVANLVIDPGSRTLTRDGQAIHLTSREFALLEMLARHPDEVLSQDQLLDGVWDATYAGGSNIVEVYVRSLRRKIDGGRTDGLIQTVRGAGYRMVARRPGHRR